MKYLIVGLGNIGNEFRYTRHNVGFMLLDYLAKQQDASWRTDRLATTTTITHKGRHIHFIKPSLYMNLSGKAVRYWMQQLNVTTDSTLIVADDINLPLGILRLRPKGGNGGHNGLKSIHEYLQTTDYPRLRFGIGNNFLPGKQADYVLGQFTAEDHPMLLRARNVAGEMVQGFCTQGITWTMNHYNQQIKERNPST